MIVSGFRSAARALPQHQLTTASRASTVTACPSLPICRASGSHQRRPSSSKASCPPGDQSDNPRAAAAPAKPAATEASPAKSAPSRTSASRSHGGRASKPRRQKDEAWNATPAEGTRNEWTDRLPSVPNTSGYSEAELKLSSLFALHRPLALGAPFPPPVPQHAFDKLFEPSSTQATSPADVVATLQSTISNLETQSQNNQPQDLRWNIVQESSSNTDPVRHLDGRPTRRPASVEEFVSQLKPYMKPAPPLPVSAQAPAPRPRRRRTPEQDYRATVVLRSVQGQPYLVGEMESIEAIPRPSTSQPRRTPSQIMSQPAQSSQQQQSSMQKRMGFTFAQWAKMRKVMRIKAGQEPRLLRRMHATTPRRPMARFRRLRKVEAPSGAGKKVVGQGEREGEEMQALSVKRQRKLKMKKHKYKKLMKRTRNLRRRLDK